MLNSIYSSVPSLLTVWAKSPCIFREYIQLLTSEIESFLFELVNIDSHVLELRFNWPHSRSTLETFLHLCLSPAKLNTFDCQKWVIFLSEISPVNLSFNAMYLLSFCTKVILQAIQSWVSLLVKMSQLLKMLILKWYKTHDTWILLLYSTNYFSI